MPRETLGTFIRERRQELGLTQEQLAKRVGEGVRQAEISRLEHDRVTLPRRERLDQIAVALRVSLGELLVRSGWMTANATPPNVAAPAIWDLDSPIQLDAIAGENLSTMIETMDAVQELVAEATQLLDHAQETLARAMEPVEIDPPATTDDT